MRLPLVAAALAAAALPTAPANAAVYPVCAAQLVHTTAATRPASCSAGNTPYVATRVSEVVVEVGAVQASLTCYVPYGSPQVTSKTVYSGSTARLSLSERSSCVTRLEPISPNAVASAVSYPVPRIYTTPPPPAP